VKEVQTKKKTEKKAGGANIFFGAVNQTRQFRMSFLMEVPQVTNLIACLFPFI